VEQTSAWRISSAFENSQAVTVSYKRFPSPVRVKFSGSSLIVSTAWDAVEYLRWWPANRSREYRVALQHCLDALDGLRSPRAAQASFVTAAKTAGLLI
jgi:hypothetical protein